MSDPAAALRGNSSVYTIGRDKDCDVAIADDSVSRIHAELVLSGGKMLLKDRDSINGTSVFQAGSPQRIDQIYVSPGDRVQFGSVVLSVHDLIDAIQAKAARRATQAPADAASPEPEVLGAKTWNRFKAWVRARFVAGQWREAVLVVLILVAAFLLWAGDPQSQSFKFLIGIVGSLVASLSFAVLTRYWDRK